MGSLAGNAWTNMPSGEKLKQLHRTVRFDYTPYGGESLEEVTQRLTDFISLIDNEYADGEVLIVTHGGVIRVLQFLQDKEPAYETEKNVSVMAFDTKKILA